MYQFNLFGMAFRFGAQSPCLAVGFPSGDSSVGKINVKTIQP